MKTRRERLARLIERALNEALPPAEGTPAVLQRAMRYCVFSRGKRFRPLLCLGACEAVGGSVRQALPTACAIELIHTYSLVHDDLPAMDNAAQRRGKPSCHRQFGEATAILVGDALLTRAFELVSHNGTPRVLEILRTIGQASGTTGLIGGQLLDLQFEVRPPRRARRAGRGSSKFEVRQLEEIAKRKTAALITASVVVGGLVGRARSSALNRLRRFGQHLGLAFQLVDDVHDGDGLVRLVGPAEVRQKADGLLEQAKRDMLPFGKRAAILLELAEWLSQT